VSSGYSNYTNFVGSPHTLFNRRPVLTPQMRDEIRALWEEERFSDDPPTKRDFSIRMAAKYGASGEAIRNML
jgi:hypothetical protein